MDLSYSPSHSPELLKLSPTHLRDPPLSVLEIHNLRRSMSRSPSKFSRSSPRSPLQHSPASTAPHSPLRHSLPPFSPSAASSRKPSVDENAASSNRKPRPVRPALARATPIRGLFDAAKAQAQQTPSSPRPLAESKDFGNSASNSSSQESMSGQENESTTPSGSPTDSFEHAIFQTKHHNIPIRTPSTRARTAAAAEKDAFAARDWAPAKSSPLKRSDGSLSSGHSSLTASPSAKRRSLHGPSFDSTRSFEDHQDGAFVDESITPEEAAFRASLGSSALGSFRKTLFQSKLAQKPSASRNRRSLEASPGSSTPKRTSVRARTRTSIDSAMASRDFPDADPPPSVQEFSVPQHARSTRQHPHPLSHAISPNSPISSVPHPGSSAVPSFDSPASSARPSIFSKSLPVGALRPHDAKFVQGHEDTAFETPRPFEVARPDPAAFRSTGLISKRHRNPDDLPPPPNGRAGMPDTPCKKTSMGLAIVSSPTSVSSIAKPRLGQPSFGTPSRPFNAHGARPAPTDFSKSMGFFDHSSRPLDFARRASFASNEGDDVVHSPSNGRESQPDSQSSADELPPTPTKQHPNFSSSKSSSLRSSLFGRRPLVTADTFATPGTPGDQVAPAKPSLFKASRPVSDVPQTPVMESGLPDPSALSISPSNKTPLSPIFRSSFGSSLVRPPATPSHRESFHSSLGHGGMATPSHHANTQDIDLVLWSRFKQVEWYARGEFSEVYKVFQAAERPSASYFSPSHGSKPHSTPRPDRVFMVKKSKSPYASSKVRQRQLREAHIMQFLGKSEHTLYLIDHWEANNHLYLQTEFCEEGTLSAFLARQGSEGRLDDFRIWKIMIELCLGVKHIHDNGFIHLDLKPENVFIDFEGTLKIGDFGLASEWPAPRNIEGEGDRRYMGPDLLLGLFDKPADIFALGMIVYETAANVIPPDNGGWWQKLRSGDFTGLPSLTSDSSESLRRESSYETRALQESRSNESLFSPASETFDSHSSIDTRMTSWGSSLEGKPHADTELQQPPAFMRNPDDDGSLDRVVHRMMAPEPSDRPVIEDVLAVEGCQWVSGRRRAGAVIYEGRWGPADHMLPPQPVEEEDSIMTGI